MAVNFPSNFNVNQMLANNSQASSGNPFATVLQTVGKTLGNAVPGAVVGAATGALEGGIPGAVIGGITGGLQAGLTGAVGQAITGGLEAERNVQAFNNIVKYKQTSDREAIVEQILTTLVQAQQERKSFQDAIKNISFQIS